NVVSMSQITVGVCTVRHSIHLPIHAIPTRRSSDLVHETEEAARKSIALDPKYLEARLLLAQVYADRKDVERAEAEYRAMLAIDRSEEHTSELQSHLNLVCRILLEKNKYITSYNHHN